MQLRGAAAAVVMWRARETTMGKTSTSTTASSSIVRSCDTIHRVVVDSLPSSGFHRLSFSWSSSTICSHARVSFFAGTVHDEHATTAAWLRGFRRNQTSTVARPGRPRGLIFNPAPPAATIPTPSSPPLVPHPFLCLSWIWLPPAS